jgi:transcriptional regulator with XRE-family HTH domain
MARRKSSPGEGPGGLPPFAARLKALREARGLTQKQLAERADLHLGAVFKLEQGKREPAWSTVLALAEALGVDCRAFAGEEPAPEAKAGPGGEGKRAPKAGKRPARGGTGKGEGRG